MENRKNDFWMISLIALWIIGYATGWNLPIRIALGLNAAVVLIDVAVQLKEARNGKKAK